MDTDTIRPRVFIWDLDDTLMWTTWAYSCAFSKFFEYMAELFDYRLLELRTLGTVSERIDADLVNTVNPKTGKPYGYSMERFPTSLVHTYRWLCEQGYGKYHEMVARRVRMIGMEAFDPLNYKKQGIVKGGMETLTYIKQKGDIQILLTKGEHLVQDYKIVALDLERWFGEDVEIVDKKTKETFFKYREKFPDNVIYSIGNSYSSDILPALDAGLLEIFIPYYTWKGEEKPSSVDTARVLEIKDIKEIIPLYERGMLKG